MEFVGRRICKGVGVLGCPRTGAWIWHAKELDASYVGTIEGAASIMTVLVDAAVRPALSVAT
jgi:hypothetical protein